MAGVSLRDAFSTWIAHRRKIELTNKVLLPILGDQYGRVLEAGEFRLRFEEGRSFSITTEIACRSPAIDRPSAGARREADGGLPTNCRSS